MDANSPWLQALRDLCKLRLVMANTMRSALLLSGLVGTLVLSVPAESRPYRDTLELAKEIGIVNLA